MNSYMPLRSYANRRPPSSTPRPLTRNPVHQTAAGGASTQKKNGEKAKKTLHVHGTSPSNRLEVSVFAHDRYCISNISPVFVRQDHVEPCPERPRLSKKIDGSKFPFLVSPRPYLDTFKQKRNEFPMHVRKLKFRDPYRAKPVSVLSVVKSSSIAFYHRTH